MVFPLELLEDIWGKDPKSFAALYQQVSGFPAKPPGPFSRGGHCISGSGKSRVEMGEQVGLLLGKPLPLPSCFATGLLLLSQPGGGETQLAVMKRPPGQICTHHLWLGGLLSETTGALCAGGCRWGRGWRITAVRS